MGERKKKAKRSLRMLTGAESCVFHTLSHSASRVFLREGTLRPGWAAALGVCLWVGVDFGAAALFSSLWTALMGAWGVTAKTLPYAPGWVMTLVACSAPIASCFQSALCLAALALFARVCRRAFRSRLPVSRVDALEADGVSASGGLCRSRGFRKAFRHSFAGLGIGFVCALLAFATLRLSDSVRSMSVTGTGAALAFWSLAAIALNALSCEALAGGIVWPLLPQGSKRVWWRALAFAPFAALPYALAGSWTLAGAIGQIALAAACCALYERFSFLAAAGLRAGWSIAAYRLLGFSAKGFAGFFFDTYPVSRDWLTGGEAGLETGAMAISLFFICAALLLLWNVCDRRKL